ncbi:hypothetical protein L9F63_011001, partial [Diploptera punctata]
SCGKCENCLRMMPNYCTKFGPHDIIGFQRDGAWAEFCVVSEDQIYKLDPCSHIRYGTLCPTLSTNLRAWNMVMPAPPDTRFLILGAGIHGKIMLGMLHYQGYKHVIIIDHCEMDRASVRKYTACALDYKIQSPSKLEGMISCRGRRRGVDVVFACTPNVHLIELAMKCQKPMGKLVIFGQMPCSKNISLPGDIFFDKEPRIIGAFLNPFTFHLAVEWAKHLGRKYLEFYPLGIKLFHLKDYKKAVRAAKDGSITMANILPCNETSFVMGHEITGVVKKVGKNVCHVEPGDKVAVNPYQACGHCEYCTKGAPHFCENEGMNTAIGFYKDGGWAEFCLLPSKHLFKLPDSVSLKHGVLVQPLSCAVHAVDLIQPTSINTRILITGVGLGAILAAKLLYYQGYTKVLIADFDYDRLQLAKANFCGYKILRPGELMSVDKVDIIIECTGNQQIIDTGLSLLRQGGKMLIYGMGRASQEI